MTRRPPSPFGTPDEEPAGEPTPQGPGEPAPDDAVPPPTPPPAEAGQDEPPHSSGATPQYPRWRDDEPSPAEYGSPRVEIPERGQIPVFDTLREAAALVNANRRTVMLPLAVISIPVSVVISLISLFLFFSVWSDEPLVTTGTLTADTPGAIIFALVVLTAVEALFAQVARGAAIRAIAGVSRGEPPSLTEALDPAFNRIGGILLLVGVFVLIIGLGVVTIIGLVIMPYLLLRLAVAFDVYMLEDCSAWSALGRSWSLMRGNMLRLLGLILLGIACVLPFILAASLLSAISGGDRNTEILLIALWNLVQTAIIIPIVAFLTACTTLYYLKAKAVENAADPA